MTVAPDLNERRCSSECADHVRALSPRKLNKGIHPFDGQGKTKSCKILVQQVLRGLISADELWSRRFGLESDKLASWKTGSAPF